MNPRKTSDPRQSVFSKHFSGDLNSVIFPHFAVISWLFSVICWSFTVILWEKVEIFSHFSPFLKLLYLRAFHQPKRRFHLRQMHFHPFFMEAPSSLCIVLDFSVMIFDFVWMTHQSLTTNARLYTIVTLVLRCGGTQLFEIGIEKVHSPEEVTG